ncbi:MAG TPA: SRPBCC family protein [Mycobacterium sp.]|nr:MAG: SRPBCC family protein [Mycobacterium sp.]HOB49039.1 SRPBCC family protein [Mycobacterium sp.]HQE15554.1 SRPBCC family protein [Mycobacterium sp.]
MASITRTRTLPAPATAVWEVLGDFGAISSWAPNVDHSCLLEHTDDVTAVGTTRRVQVRRNTLVERITESSPPNVLSYDIEGLPRRLGRVSNRWVVAAVGQATLVTLTSTVRIADNPVAWAAERAVCRAMAKHSDAMLDGLAQRMGTAYD